MPSTSPPTPFRKWWTDLLERSETLTGEDLARAAWNAAIQEAAGRPAHYPMDEKTEARYRRGFGQDGADEALSAVWSFHPSDCSRRGSSLQHPDD